MKTPAVLLRCGFLAGLLLCSGAAVALEYRSVAEAAILYDAPSAKAQKLFVLSRDYPVEVVVKASGAEARQSASDAAALVFTAEKGVVLEFLQLAGGWVKVRHPDGAVGF